MRPCVAWPGVNWSGILAIEYMPRHARAGPALAARRPAFLCNGDFDDHSSEALPRTDKTCCRSRRVGKGALFRAPCPPPGLAGVGTAPAAPLPTLQTRHI